MPVYRTYLRMANDVTWPVRRKWSYAFLLNTANAPAAAAALVAGWIDHLRGSHRSSVFAYEVYATSAVEGDTDYTVQTINPGQQRGSLAVSVDLGNPYLTKACLSLALQVPASRPSRKFIRPGIYEYDTNDGATVRAEVLTAFLAGWTTLQAALGTTWVDPGGAAITGIGRVKLTTREFGRSAGNDVPAPPAVG